MRHAITVALLMVHGVPTSSQAQEVEDLRTRFDSAVAALDSARIEQAVGILRSLVGQFGPTTPVDLRSNAHLRLGEAYWSLGSPDSAAAHFSAAVKADPFARPDPDLFHPELMNTFRTANRTTVTLGVRAVTDTTIEPLDERWPLTLAVGLPSDVELRLGAPEALQGDSLVAIVRVDSMAQYAVSLLVGDSVPLTPGTYAIRGIIAGTGGTDTVQVVFTLEKQSVDTAAHEPPPALTLFRLETEKGAPPVTSLLRGLFFGAAAATIPLLLFNKDVGDDAAQPHALVVGATITVGGLIGLSLGRPYVPISENIVFNRQLTEDWERRNAAIARDNALKVRLAPLRIRVQLQR